MDLSKALAYLTPVICIIIAGMLAYSGQAGWGWFLFIGLMMAR